MIKRFFLEGLVLVVPLVLTVLLFIYLVAFFSSPLDLLIVTLFPSLPYPFITAKFLALLITVSIFLLVGYLAERLIVSYLIKKVRTFFSKIPIVKMIYHSSTEVITTLLREKDRGFSETTLFSLETQMELFWGLFQGKMPLLSINTPF